MGLCHSSLAALNLDSLETKVVRFSGLICYFHLPCDPISRSKQSRSNRVAGGRCSQSHTFPGLPELGVCTDEGPVNPHCYQC